MLCARYDISMSNLSALLKYMGDNHILMYNGCRLIRNIIVIPHSSIRRPEPQCNNGRSQPSYVKRRGGGMLNGSPRM